MLKMNDGVVMSLLLDVSSREREREGERVGEREREGGRQIYINE